jgi:hypothetical protein
MRNVEVSNIGGVYIRGGASVFSLFGRVSRRHSAGYQAGLIRVGRLVMGYSQSIVPVDTEALKRSGYAYVWGSGFEAELDTGYTQYYAVWVHEDLTMSHAPGTSAKFLSLAYSRQRLQIYAIMAKAMVLGR